MKTEKKIAYFLAIFPSIFLLASSSAYSKPFNSDTLFYEDGQQSPAKVTLGKLLFFDKILSGNKNTSCATCHHTLTATGDGLSLPSGEGGQGLGITRNTGSGEDAIVERVPRNSPHLFNLGAREFETLFFDGRVSRSDLFESGFLSPAGDQLPLGLDNPLAVQAMFPVTSSAEMAGQLGENAVADATAIDNFSGTDGVWTLLAERIRVLPAYVKLFKAAFPEQINTASDIQMKDAANAIAAFEASAWRADNSDYDRFIRGDNKAMSPNAKRGKALFYGKAGCAVCHSGYFQTDQQFHAIAMPQIGPGKGDGVDGHDDFGREAVSGNSEDRYQFRTPTLRNVAITGPWGHDGAYNSLLAVVKHHLNPIESLENYDTTQAVLPSRDDLDAIDFVVHQDPQRRAAIAQANELEPVRLNDQQIGYIIDFLHALTDRHSLDLRANTPATVPSGLPVFD